MSLKPVALALSGSLLLSLTVIPVLASYCDALGIHFERIEPTESRRRKIHAPAGVVLAGGQAAGDLL